MNLRDAMGPGLVAVACATATVAYATRPDPPAVPSIGAVAHPLLGGLTVGDRVAGWNVIELVGRGPGAVDVRYERDGVEFVLSAVPLGEGPSNPPFSSQTHAIFYGHARPTDAAVPSGGLRAVSADLIRRLDRD
jgi:hypothetical protein